MSCKSDNILVSFFEENHFKLCQCSLYLNQIWPYVPLMCARFELHLITRAHFIAVFCKCMKKRKIRGRKKENEQLFKGSYLRNGWSDVLQIWHAISPDMPALSQQIWSCSDKRSQSYEWAENCTLFFMFIYLCCEYMPRFLGPHDTLPSVLIHTLNYSKTFVLDGMW